MGGDLDPVTSYFYKKKKLSAQEPIVLDESKNENNDVMISVPIEENDWRLDMMGKYASEDLTKLDDLAPEHQRQQRNKETLKNFELELETNNFEDIYVYYAIFDNKFSRTSPHSDVEACYKIQGSQYRQKALLYHPDKNQDKTAEVKVNAAQQYRET